MTQTGKDKPIVFVSHVEEDAVIASKIKNWLEDNLLERVEVFVSSDEGIKLGDKWEERIIDKLQSCCIALVVCTQTSVRQPWINFEAWGCVGARCESNPSLLSWPEKRYASQAIIEPSCP